MDGSSGRLRTTPRLRDFRRLGAACFVGALAVIMTAPAALAAPQVQVSGGTLSIAATGDAAVSAGITRYTPFADVVGPQPGKGTLSVPFAYGPRFLWHGMAPVSGAGCGPQPGGSGGEVHLTCADVLQMDIVLGGGDDYLNIASSNAPVRVSGGAGDDGLAVSTSEAGATLDGGRGNDSLRVERAGTVHGGPGDDYISVENTSLVGQGAVVDCGPGDDVVVDNYYYLGTAPPTIDEATCGPVLRPVQLPTPPGPGELAFAAAIKPRHGRVKLKAAFRSSEAGRGTLVLKRARSVTRLGFPRPGTRWAACSERRRFRMRAGRVVRTTLPLVRAVARRVTRLRPPGRWFSRKSLIACSLHISGVDDDGEHFHRDDFSLVLTNPN